jgi:hypothetical protein
MNGRSKVENRPWALLPSFGPPAVEDEAEEGKVSDAVLVAVSSQCRQSTEINQSLLVFVER